MSAPPTPMMAQYLAMRQSLPKDVLLLFHLGDFYELFFDDAIVAAPLLGVALTQRQGTPMCGIPIHAAQGYLGKLLQAGKRVAIAEQSSEPSPGKLVSREITRVFTPGSIDELGLLDEARPNYLVALAVINKRFGLAAIEHSTGHLLLAEYDAIAALRDELDRLAPAEILVPEPCPAQLPTELAHRQPIDGYLFEPYHAAQILQSHYKVLSLEGFGVHELHAAVAAAGAALHYLQNQLKRPCEHLLPPKLLAHHDDVVIDAASRRNLDLLTARSGPKHCLLGVIDHTLTPMGARLLRHWLLHPTRHMPTLIERQEWIAALVAAPTQLACLREELASIRDLERLASRLAQGSAHPRDLATLARSLLHVPLLQGELERLAVPQTSLGMYHCLVALAEHLLAALSEPAPVSPRDGGIIAEGYHAMLDELRAAARDGKNWLAKLQTDERQRTGIDSLKIKYNGVFGYFIEVSSAKLDKVPGDYQRRQTLANAERFTTPELKAMEAKILGAEERARQLEYELFIELRQTALNHLQALQETAAAIARLDVLCALAYHAHRNRHCRPTLRDEPGIEIRGGRHPIVEHSLPENSFIANDTFLHAEHSRLHLITGPNMAGKSTYIRQVATIAVLAHLGAFVPATSATIGLTDRIFCRVGASDDLARGHSTFMVEMAETALILNAATPRSLVILDEIGRGTATFDGLSIAWAVAEYLYDTLRPLTLFATHYHELTALAGKYSAVENYQVAVHESDEGIIFLHKIVPGSADKSYGIQVARLAGLPNPVIARATAIMNHLEGSSRKAERASIANPAVPRAKLPLVQEFEPDAQLDLFAFDDTDSPGSVA